MPSVALQQIRDELGDRFPAAVLAIPITGAGRAGLESMVVRLVPPLAALFGRVLLLAEERVDREVRPLGDEIPGVRVVCTPQDLRYGERRKVAYELALELDVAHVFVVEIDGLPPPEELARLWLGAIEQQAAMAIGVWPEPRRARRSWRQRAFSGLHNLVLGLSLTDYRSPLRCLATRLLRRVPFELNSAGRRFDTELVIQARALQESIREVALGGVAPKTVPLRLLSSLRAAAGYRLHQLHVLRRGRYLVRHEVHYSFKRSPTGSHVQILDAIAPGSRVLDLGCSQGLLAAPLREKGVSVSGVDTLERGSVSRELAEYYVRDLEEPLDLPEGRDFDYVLLADVIEHIRNREQLLKSVRRYLRPTGRLIISTPNIAIWFYRLSLLVGRFEYGPRGILDETHVHLFTQDTFRRLVQRGNYRIRRELVTTLPFEVVFESTGRSRLVAVAASAYHLLARSWPRLFAYQFIIEAELASAIEDSAGELEGRELEGES